MKTSLGTARRLLVGDYVTFLPQFWSSGWPPSSDLSQKLGVSDTALPVHCLSVTSFAKTNAPRVPPSTPFSSPRPPPPSRMPLYKNGGGVPAGLLVPRPTSPSSRCSWNAILKIHTCDAVLLFQNPNRTCWHSALIITQPLPAFLISSPHTPCAPAMLQL